MPRSRAARLLCQPLEDRTVPALVAANVAGLFDTSYYLTNNPDVAAAIPAGGRG